jgi:hypothetical protein
MVLFVKTFDISDQTRILDVGGTPYNWQLIDCPAQITLLNLNLPDPLPILPSNINFIQGDGTNLQFGEKSFDIVFSNSVIEHLYTFENQKKFSEEVNRVGKSLWIQTPSRSFFFEPHFLTPFYHYLPKKLQYKLAKNFTIWGWIARPTTKYSKNKVDEINLLSLQQFQSLFPDCLIKKEMFLGFATKSFIAIKKNKTMA